VVIETKNEAKFSDEQIQMLEQQFGRVLQTNTLTAHDTGMTVRDIGHTGMVATVKSIVLLKFKSATLYMDKTGKAHLTIKMESP
jgi:hypothetical protein